MKHCKTLFLPLLLCLTILSAALPARAQRCADSLMERLYQAPTDTARVHSLFDLVYYYAFVNIDSCKEYTNQLLALSVKMNFPFAEFYAYHGSYYSYITLGNYPKAIEVALSNLTRARALTYKPELSQAIALQDLALAYRIMQNNEEAIRYAREAVSRFQLFPVEFPSEYGSAVSAIGMIKLRTNQRDSAMYYLQKGLELAVYHTSRSNITAALNQAFIGDGLVAFRRYREAGDNYFAALASARYLNCLYIESRLLNNLANLKKLLGEYDSSLYYARASVRISAPHHFEQYAMDAYNILGQVYDSLQNADSALKYIKLANAANNAIFSQTRIQQFNLLDYNEKKRQQEMAAAAESYRGRLRIYGLLVAFGIALLIAVIFYRNSQQRKKTNLQLSQQKADLESTLVQLRSTQSQLVQAEKMASLGEITAGIAHEIQNPLNFVNNFSEVNQELTAELKDEINKSAIEGQLKREWTALIQNISSNEAKIIQHGKRADAIVKNMLQHSRASTGQKTLTDINALADEYLKLAYHGMRAREKDFSIALVHQFDQTIERLSVSPQDLGRAMLNLFSNAIHFAGLKQRSGGVVGYEPELRVSTKNLGSQVEIRVRDNGPGIPSRLIGKIFQPFFTTKPTGQGTGLGLSLAYDIITKEHGGTITVQSREGEFTEFIIRLPV